MEVARDVVDSPAALELSPVQVLRQGESSPPDPDQIRVLVVDSPSSEAELADADVVLTHIAAVGAAGRPYVDVPDTAAALATIREAVARNPVAALSLARLLRVTEKLDVREGLAAESATFSMLLAGAEFERWLARRGEPRAPDGDQRVEVSRVGDLLTITLNRPRRRNAYDRAMRDQLLEALQIARLDPVVRVRLTGSGPDFCAGGDLDEFGTAKDVAVAHIIRLAASVGGLIDDLRDRVVVDLHGNVVGSGIELAAFAGTVRAAGDTRIQLPEVAMGLVPGAGGTVSLTRRIGRHRLLWWALTGAVIGAETAVGWGLVDELRD